MKSHYSVVVIGGGIVGCSVLYHLTQLGRNDIALVERNELTSGSTWHAAGQNHLYAGSWFLRHIAKESFEMYQKLEADTGDSCGVHVTGGVRLARSQDGMDEFKRYLGPAHSEGIDAEIIGPERVRELWPLLQSDKYIGALHTPGEGYVDASMSTQTLAKAARLAGAEIFQQTNVVSLSEKPSGEWHIETNQGMITAEVVVNCGGSWGAEISRLLGFYLPVFTMEHQYMVTEQSPLLDALEVELPVLRDTSVPYYCRQERQGLMVSAFEHQAKLRWLDGAPDGFSRELFAEDLDRSAELLKETYEMIPALQELGIRTIVNGPIPATPDMLALVGPAHGLRNYFTCCGVHGGFVHASLGRYLAEWIAGGEPAIDLSSVDVRRFGDYATTDYGVSNIHAAHTIFSLPASYPEMEPEGGRLARIDALYPKLADKGAVFGVVNGWEVPNWFAPTGVEAVDEWTFKRANWFPHVSNECKKLRESAGLLNLSWLSKFRIEGRGAYEFLDRLSANNLPSTRMRATCPLLAPSGGIEALVNIDHLADNCFFVTAAAGAEIRLADWLTGQGAVVHGCSGDASVENVTETKGILLLSGPNSISILEQGTAISLDRIAPGELVDVSINSETARIVRTDDIDESTWEIHCDGTGLLTVYQTLTALGKSHGIVDIGKRAWNSLRLERGIGRWGIDFVTDMTPLSAGLDQYSRGGDSDFVGKAAMHQKENKRNYYKLALLKVENSQLPIDPWGGEMIENNGKVIGLATSGARGHTTNQSLVFAQLDLNFSRIGTQVQIRLFDKKYDAEVIEPPKGQGFPAVV